MKSETYKEVYTELSKEVTFNEFKKMIEKEINMYEKSLTKEEREEKREILERFEDCFEKESLKILSNAIHA